jgi:hypothetical protein
MNVQKLDIDVAISTATLALGDSVLMQIAAQARRDSVKLIINGVAIGSFGEAGGSTYYIPSISGYHDVRAVAWHHSTSRTSALKWFTVTQ